jgi:hypothetical protein
VRTTIRVLGGVWPSLPSGLHPARSGPGQPRSSPARYTLDQLLPVAHQREAFVPHGHAARRAFALMLAGWLLAAVVVAGPRPRVPTGLQTTATPGLVLGLRLIMAGYPVHRRRTPRRRCSWRAMATRRLPRSSARPGTTAMTHEYVARKYKRTTTLGADSGRYGERTSGERDNQAFGTYRRFGTPDCRGLSGYVGAQIIRLWVLASCQLGIRRDR